MSMKAWLEKTKKSETFTSLSRRFNRSEATPATNVESDAAIPPSPRRDSGTEATTTSQSNEAVISGESPPTALPSQGTPPALKRQSSRPACETCGAVASAIVTGADGARHPFCRPCVEREQAIFARQMEQQMQQQQQQQQQASSASHHQSVSASGDHEDSLSWRERARRAQATLMGMRSSAGTDVNASSAGGSPPQQAGSANDGDDDDGFFSGMFLRAREHVDSLRRSRQPAAVQQSTPPSTTTPSQRRIVPGETRALTLEAPATVLGLPLALFVARVLPLVVSEQRDIERLSLVDRSFCAALIHHPPSGWTLHLRDSPLAATERCPKVRRFSRFDGIAFDRVMFIQPFSAQPLQVRCLGGGAFKALCDFAHQAASATSSAERASGESMLHLKSIDLSACHSTRDMHWREASPFERIHTLVSLRHIALGTLELGAHERFWTLLAQATSLVSIDAGLMAAATDDVRALNSLPALETLHVRARDWPAAVVSQLPTRLRELTLRGGTIDLRVLAALADSLTRLESLSASAVLTGAASPALARLLRNGLRSIELRAASTPEAPVCVARTIIAMPTCAVESLVLGDVGDDGDTVGEAIFKCASLRRFSAAFAEPSAADGALDALHQAQHTRLRSLRIVGATDIGLKTIRKFGAALQSLDVARNALCTAGGLVGALANSHALAVLDVSHIASAATALVKLAPQLAQLRELRMDRCGVGDEALEALGAHCRRLEIVSMAGNDGATSPGMAGAMLRWSLLHTLRIAACPALDDSVLATIASCLTLLRRLTLSDRSAVSSVEILFHMELLAELTVVQALSESLEPEPLRLFTTNAQTAFLKANPRIVITIETAQQSL
jgi:hypothetical protein